MVLGVLLSLVQAHACVDARSLAHPLTGSFYAENMSSLEELSMLTNIGLSLYFFFSLVPSLASCRVHLPPILLSPSSRSLSHRGGLGSTSTNRFFPS